MATFESFDTVGYWDAHPMNPANMDDGPEVDERDGCHEAGCEHKAVPLYLGCALHEHLMCIEDGEETPQEIREQAEEDGIELN